MKSIYEFKDYKKYLRNMIELNQLSRGYQTRMAVAAGCSRSFLSQVLSHGMDVDLTRDHAAGLARLWELGPGEFEYLLTLVDLQKATATTLKEHIEKKIDRLRAEQRKLSTRVESEQMTDTHLESIYYSSWILGGIHVLLTNRRYRDPKSIADRLRLEISEVDRALEKLAQTGLAKRQAGGWVPTKKDLNLAESSPMRAVNHMNWRHRAVASLQARKKESIYYSSVFTVSAEDAAKLKTMIADFIMASRKVILASSEEELVCINIDCFEL